MIVVYANGGQSQLETWDPKPDAPREVRGEFGAIASAVPGVFLGEHLPALARLADRYTIVRSVSHDDLDHGSATYLALTGRYHPQKSGNPPPSPTDAPALGALLRRLRASSRSPYTAVHVQRTRDSIPELPAGARTSGFLGREYDPLQVGDVTAGSSSMPSFSPTPELPPARLVARRSLLESLDVYRRTLDANPRFREFDSLRSQAYRLLDSPPFPRGV